MDDLYCMGAGDDPGRYCDAFCTCPACAFPLVPGTSDVIDWDAWVAALWDEEAQDLHTAEDVARIAKLRQDAWDAWGAA